MKTQAKMKAVGAASNARRNPEPDTSATLDRLRKAKDALIYAKHAAERELPASEVRQLEIIIGKIEALQNKINNRRA